MSVAFGFLLLLAVVVTGWLLMGAIGGALTGAMLLLQAPYLYISRMALYDVVAAAFLGVGVACLVAAERDRARPAKPLVVGWWLAVGAASLVAASVAKYVTILYVPLAAAIVLWRFRGVHSLLCFMLPVAVLGGWYLWGALLPVFPSVMRQLENVAARGQASFELADIVVMLTRWLVWPALLAMAGMGLASKSGLSLPGQRPRSRASDGVDGLMGSHARSWCVLFLLLALALPIAHLATGSVQGLNKNVVLSLIFLAPIAAYGVWRLTQPFTVERAFNAQWLLIGVVIMAMAWGGVRHRSWLEHQYPDLTPVVAELNGLVTAQTVLMADTDALYRYALADRLPADGVVLTYWVGYQGLGGEAGALRFVEDQRPDYIILDGYYGQAARHQRLRVAMGEHYQLRHRWPLELSWGQRTVDLYERKGAAT